MGRRRSSKEGLTRIFSVRVSDRYYKRLEEIKKNSNCQYIGEVARRILYREEIVWYHKDASMDSTVAELTLIRKELNAIGININQITRHFHSADIPNQKIFHALKIVDEYKKVGQKLEKVMSVTSEITKKWLRR
ncbi:MAG: plasmid mobilization relaxosome protein MobC [Cyclobacteriaceae bacterium]